MSNGLVDADQHITEPPDTWTSRVSKKWGDQVPHVKWSDTSRKGGGEYAWFIGDNKLGPVYSNAHISRDGVSVIPWPDFARTPDEVHPSAWDARERVKLMDRCGIDTAAVYANYGGFGNKLFLELGAPELMAECVRAYNDFVVDWTSVAPERFIPICSAPMWDVEFAAAEIHRSANIGHRAVMFSGKPQDHGFPPLGDLHWDPIWSAIEETGMALSFHVGSGDLSRFFNLEMFLEEGFEVVYARANPQMFLATGFELIDLLTSRILVRHPNLRVVWAECGIGHIPFILDAVDYHFLRGNVRSVHPEFTELPSTYFKRQCAVTFWFERATDALLDRIGVDNVMFETDFPHPTGLITRDEIDQHVDVCVQTQPAAVRDKILRQNALRMYGIPE